MRRLKSVARSNPANRVAGSFTRSPIVTKAHEDKRPELCALHGRDLRLIGPEASEQTTPQFVSHRSAGFHGAAHRISVLIRPAEQIVQALFRSTPRCCFVRPRWICTAFFRSASRFDELAAHFVCHSNAMVSTVTVICCE